MALRICRHCSTRDRALSIESVIQERAHILTNGPQLKVNLLTVPPGYGILRPPVPHPSLRVQ